MPFNAIMMSQLGICPKPLREEILEILAAASEPMNVIQIFDRSAVAVTSRDVSLELVKMKKSAGLVDVGDMRKRPGFREVAHWVLTEKGRQGVRA